MTYIRKLTLMILLWSSLSSAFAAMVPTDRLGVEVEPAELAQNPAQRENVKQQLIELGVNPLEATQRVDRMTDQQIYAMQEKIAELPAGAGVSTTNLLLIIIILLLIL